jgi:hypothetical protein
MWLGHTDISTTGRYLAVTAESLKRTLKRLEDARKVRPVRRSGSFLVDQSPRQLIGYEGCTAD